MISHTSEYRALKYTNASAENFPELQIITVYRVLLIRTRSGKDDLFPNDLRIIGFLDYLWVEKKSIFL